MAKPPPLFRPRLAQAHGVARSVRPRGGAETRRVPSNEKDLAATLDSLDLVVREAPFGGREIAALEVDDLGAADHAKAFRAGSVDVPQHRIGEPTGLTPPQFVQDLPGGAGHGRRHGDVAFSPSWHKDHIRPAGCEGRWSTRRTYGRCSTARRRTRETP